MKGHHPHKHISDRLWDCISKLSCNYFPWETAKTKTVSQEPESLAVRCFFLSVVFCCSSSTLFESANSNGCRFAFPKNNKKCLKCRGSEKQMRAISSWIPEFAILSKLMLVHRKTKSETLFPNLLLLFFVSTRTSETYLPISSFSRHITLYSHSNFGCLRRSCGDREEKIEVRVCEEERRERNKQILKLAKRVRTGLNRNIPISRTEESVFPSLSVLLSILLFK